MKKIVRIPIVDVPQNAWPGALKTVNSVKNQASQINLHTLRRRDNRMSYGVPDGDPGTEKGQ